ncbi:AIP3-domain-containing protein [Myriangium duriaei CBS 260.36]|uniref:AIP3-domain-containing protein n=1 Tax=Myriangium duriaei CBS 260.36 TaxID=1168546 RepID=A0A9P4J679_9PEZI|nr:AIP3-domain-containing protein [Myriangium duriaei CBS 260.36]
MASEMPQQRSSSGSGRQSSSRSRQSQQPQQQLSQIEKSVTHLLVATKQLLETLTMWSRAQATETEVSDVYVRLGYEFNIACRAFNNIGVETNDLGPVPDLLRAILEETLSQEASQASLDRFLPRIRDIIINLLHGLKKKQSRLRQRTTQGGVGSAAGARDGPSVSRQVSMASTGSNDTTITQTLDDAVRRQQSASSFTQRTGSAEVGAPDLPPRTTSVQSQSSRQSPRRETFNINTNFHRPREPSRETNNSTDSSLSGNTLQNLPVVLPYPSEDQMPNELAELSGEPSPPPPAPPPKQVPMQKDALAALQRGGELERRASRRFSAYQISKHLGAANGVASIIPPAQHSPIPNRGREAQESINAVRTRSTYLSNRDRAAYRVNHESSPLRRERREIQEEPQEVVQPDQQFKLDLDSPLVKTPDDKLAGYSFPTKEDLAGANEDETVLNEVEAKRSSENEALIVKPPSAVDSVLAQPPPPRVETPLAVLPQFVPETSPQAGKELTLFLQYKSKIKKFVLSDGANLTIARLQLAFIEKFAWNTQNNGVDLPEIYIQDPVSGVRHELEDLNDIKDRSVLVLNIEALDEVKKHFDDGVDGLKRMIEGVKSAVDDQQSALQRVSDRQQEAAKEIASLAAAPPRPALPTSSSKSQLWTKDSVSQLNEVQALRRDLAVVRQTYTSFAADIDASMAQIRTKASSVRTKALDANIPKMSIDTGRAYVNNGKKTLQEDSEKIVTSVDDLQDIVEDLRKDVVTRGVRPLARQLETVSKEISSATAQLKKLQEYLKREKPVWTKIWEKELQVVCDDRDLLTMQEELCIDLEDDLEKAAATFALVEQATRQQHLDNPKGHSGRSTSRNLNPLSLDQGADPLKAKDGVLGEVKALRPNHETRLEAIERAEKARQRELESRKGGEFQKELGNFVEEGKLKKSGGVEEVERLRKMKDERAIKGYYERIAARTATKPDDATASVTPEAPTVEAELAPESNGDVASTSDASKLEVPDRNDGGVSPEPEFVEAKEEPISPTKE